MSETGNTLTDWTPNDYSNIITIGAAAIGTTLLVIFKSRCKNISLCCGLINCIRDVKSDSEGEEEENNNAAGAAGIIPPDNP